MKAPARWLPPVLALALPLALYLLTCSRSVGPVDAGELIVAAATGGVAHPPGFPLFLLLGRLFTLLPVGTPAFLVAALSAVTSAGAALGIYLTACCLLEGPHRRLLALAAALLTATAFSVWEWATVAEVYGLNLCLFTLVLWGVARWHQAVPGGSASRNALILVACLGGLGAANHTTTFAILGGTTLVTLLVPLSRGSILRGEARRGRTVLLLLAALLLPLSLYLYLPLAARSGSAMNWGDPRDASALLRHVTGWQYQEYLTGGSAARFFDTLGTVFLPLWLRQWGVW